MKIKHIGFFLNDAIFIAERVMDDLVGYCDMESTEKGTICHLQIVVDGKIVRCKDCKHWIPNIPKYAHIGYKVCNHEYNDGLCEGIGYEWGADDFCSRGERK